MSRHDLLETIRTSAKRGSEMVNQILSFTRGATGEMLPVRIHNVIREVVKLISDTIPRTISIESTVDEDLPPILGDSTQLHQVLLNLCVNARDAMPEGGQLSIRAERVMLERKVTPMQPAPVSGSFIELTVTDTGSGIPPELQAKVFEPFFTTKEPGKGTGIGLSTVNGIVKSHNGVLELDSEPGEGTTFRIYLPVAKMAHEPRSRRSVPALQHGKGECILVVDDEVAIIQITQNALQAYNYRVISAKDGVEAVRVFLENRDKVSLIMTDMMMPGLAGDDLIKAFREVEPDVKIIAISGHAGQQTIADTHQGNVKAFLHKPFSITKLLATLHATLHA